MINCKAWTKLCFLYSVLKFVIIADTIEKCLIYIQVGSKNGTMISYALNLLNINRFRNCFTVGIRRPYAIIQSLNIPPHLKCVVTLPCEMSLSGTNCHSVSLITPLVSGVAGLNASSSSNVDTLNI